MSDWVSSKDWSSSSETVSCAWSRDSNVVPQSMPRKGGVAQVAELGKWIFYMLRDLPEHEAERVCLDVFPTKYQCFSVSNGMFLISS